MMNASATGATGAAQSTDPAAAASKNMAARARQRPDAAQAPDKTKGSFDDCLNASRDQADSSAQNRSVDTTPSDDGSAEDRKAKEDKSGDDDSAHDSDMPVLSLLLPQLSITPAADAAPSSLRSGTESVAGGALASLAAAFKSLPQAAVAAAATALTQDAASSAQPAPVNVSPDAASSALLAMLNASGGVSADHTNAAASAVADTQAQDRTPLHGDFAEPLAERIVWMNDTARANGGSTQQARIELHPAEWGSLQIRVELQHDGATKVSFDVATPQARQAIENSLPQLRELLSPSGGNALSLQFQLSGGGSQQQASPQASVAARGLHAGVDEGEAVDAVPLRTRQRLGLVDQFA